ncbi:hypothetical protein [Photobacterium sp. R1]
MKTRILASLVVSIALIACSESKPDFQVNSIKVSDFAYEMGGKPAVNINLAQDEKNFCDVTIWRADVKQGFDTTLKQKSSGNISSTCIINGKTFMQSSKHPTIASLTIDELDAQNNKAVLRTSLKLVDIKTLDEFFEVKDLRLPIDGEQFVNLVELPE